MPDLLTRISLGPLINYAERRSQFRTLKSIPEHVYRSWETGHVLTRERRRNAAVWLWANVTGGHKWDAPAWRGSPGANDKENFRRFLKRDLPTLEPHLLAYGVQLLADGESAEAS